MLTSGIGAVAKARAARTRDLWPFVLPNETPLTNWAAAQLVIGVPIVGTKGLAPWVRAWSKALQSEVGLSSGMA
ncbi:hypothetical protein ACH5RR_026772 [Cinchona calisaya]|uniref:Uncharacterized protein n=1 Tax=Cinchona calisaya TaxID=153742 RepID=A0ABD2Z3J7_9GENT